MTTALLLLPDFLLIALGFGLSRWSALRRPIWEASEQLVYYLLFPALLVRSTLTSHLDPGEALPIVGIALGVTLLGIVLALALARWPGVDARAHASGAQTAYRFNSYIALALADRLVGGPGVTWVALCIAVCVPIVNVAAVWPLARHGGHAVGRELLRNPLIVATVIGLAGNLAGVRLPGPVDTTLARLGTAALPLGLLATGAGLQIGGLLAAPGLAAALMAIRHAVLPAVTLALTTSIGLPRAQRLVLVMFMALPTASSTYVLAARLGGDAGFVAGLVMLSTLLGMVGVPVWLALAH